MNIKRMSLSALASLSLAGLPSFTVSGRGDPCLDDKIYRATLGSLGSTKYAAWHKAFNRRLPRNKASQRRAAKARAQRRARRLGQA